MLFFYRFENKNLLKCTKYLNKLVLEGIFSVLLLKEITSMIFPIWKDQIPNQDNPGV